MLTLEIPGDIFERMVEQAKAEAPIEACGILAGSDGKVEKLYTMTNIDQSRTHCMMEPQEQFAVIRDIRASGLTMLAMYHSHPETPARPSDEDIRLALTPEVIYVIVSLRNPDAPAVKGFLIKDGTITTVPIEVTNT